MPSHQLPCDRPHYLFHIIPIGRVIAEQAIGIHDVHVLAAVQGGTDVVIRVGYLGILPVKQLGE